MEPEESANRIARVAATFDRIADTYDTVDVPWFTPIAQATVALAGPRPGERALDLGTGRGAALWPLAEGVGPAGHVTGVDVSARMVELTRADVAARGLAHVDVRLGDATALDVPPASFDLAVASLVLFFLPDPGAALARWRQALVPGGRLGVSTFAPRSARWLEVDDVFTDYLPAALLDARTSGTRGPFASDEGLVDLLAGAGLVDAATSHLDLTVRFRDVEHWRAWTWSHGQRSHWLAVPEERRPAVLAEVAARVSAWQDDSGAFELEQRVRLTRAARPA